MLKISETTGAINDTFALAAKHKVGATKSDLLNWALDACQRFDIPQVLDNPNRFATCFFPIFFHYKMAYGINNQSCFSHKEGILLRILE